jgi:hypothetical protein
MMSVTETVLTRKFVSVQRELIPIKYFAIPKKREANRQEKRSGPVTMEVVRFEVLCPELLLRHLIRYVLLVRLRECSIRLCSRTLALEGEARKSTLKTPGYVMKIWYIMCASSEYRVLLQDSEAGWMSVITAEGSPAQGGQYFTGYFLRYFRWPSHFT